jgi:cytidine deaminase
VTIDWPVLRASATAAAERAYAPYSGLRVGAAGLTADGQVVTGCNVENSSYGLTLCAECGLVSALHASGAVHASGAGTVDASGAGVSRCCPAAAAASCCSKPADLTCWSTPRQARSS